MRAVVLFICLLCGHSAVSGADEIIVFDANESPPFWSVHLKYQGMCGEILAAMSRLSGIKTRIRFRPLRRLIADTANNDVGNPIFYMQKQYFAHIIPIAVYTAAVYYYRPHHSKALTQFNLASLKGYKIGILKGTLARRDVFSGLGVTFETSYKQAAIFKKLKLGRIDLAVEIELVAEQVIRRLYPNDYKNFKSVPIPRSVTPIALMLNADLANADDIAQKYRQALQSLIRSGEYQKIVQKYYYNAQLPDNWLTQLRYFDNLYRYW